MVGEAAPENLETGVESIHRLQDTCQEKAADFWGEGRCFVLGGVVMRGLPSYRGGSERGVLLSRAWRSASAKGLERCQISVPTLSLQLQLRRKTRAHLSWHSHSAGRGKD